MPIIPGNTPLPLSCSGGIEISCQQRSSPPLNTGRDPGFLGRVSRSIYSGPFPFPFCCSIFGGGDNRIFFRVRNAWGLVPFCYPLPTDGTTCQTNRMAHQGRFRNAWGLAKHDLSSGHLTDGISEESKITLLSPLHQIVPCPLL